METFSALLTGEFTGLWIPHSQWRRAVMLSLICAWINDLVNNGEAGDLKPYHARYVVTDRK